MADLAEGGGGSSKGWAIAGSRDACEDTPEPSPDGFVRRIVAALGVPRRQRPCAAAEFISQNAPNREHGPPACQFARGPTRQALDSFLHLKLELDFRKPEKAGERDAAGWERAE